MSFEKVNSVILSPMLSIVVPWRTKKTNSFFWICEYASFVWTRTNGKKNLDKNKPLCKQKTEITEVGDWKWLGRKKSYSYLEFLLRSEAQEEPSCIIDVIIRWFCKTILLNSFTRLKPRVFIKLTVWRVELGGFAQGRTPSSSTLRSGGLHCFGE